MKRTIMIILATILIMSLIINSYANAQEEAPEDILLYPDVYMPRVVSSYDLETPSSIGQGSVFPVFVTLKGIKTNPIVEISKIDSIRITLDQSSSKYSAAPRHLAPKSRTYTLDNMGYLIVNLKKDPLKKDENIPSSIDLNLKATIYYKVNTGFGVFPQDVILKELSEQEFNSQRAQYNFWNTRGYLRLIKLENGIATISVYDERGNKITTLEPLSPGQTSRQFTLRRLYFEDEQELKFRDRAKIRFIKTISGEKAANLQILFNNQLQFIQRFEREQLYPGSAWRIKSITSSPQINQVVLENTATDEIKTLYKNQKSEIDCKQLTSQEDCILINQCQWTGTNCVSKKEQTTTQLSVQTQPSIDDSAAKTEFENLKKQHSQVQEKINKLSDEEIKNKASELISEIKSLENGYFSFMDKYSAPVWLSLARHRLLNSQVPFYISVWTLYDKLEEITNDRETYEKLKNELLARDKNYHDKVYITSETEAVSKDSREYYLDAIRNYENVANSYPEVKDDQGNELGPIAQSRIAEIYQNNLNDFGKASSSYKKLLNEFSSSEYVKSQQEIIKRWIELLEDRANYNINAEQIIEDGNIIDVALNDIAAVGEGSKAFIEINNLVKKEGYKLGDSPIPGWVIDEINSNDIVLIKRTDQRDIHQNIKINQPITLDDNYKITLLRTDTKSQIIVTVLPGEERTFSVSRFTVHIPIEKRFFKLTPEQIEKEIQATNNAIKTLDNVIDKTSKLWNVYTGYCLTYASYLYVKNFFTDKTTVKARKEVIDKWKSYCVDLVKEYEKTYETAKTNSYSSTQDCLNENAKSIEEEVNYAKEIIENVESDPTFKDKPYLREAEVKRRIADNAINKNKDPGLIKKYVDDFLTTEKNANQQGRINFDVDQIKNYLYDKEGKRIENVNFEELFKKYPELQSYKEEINILKDSNTKGFEKEQAINNILEKERLARSYEYNKEFINSEAGYSKYNVNDAVTTFFNKLKQPATTQKDEGQEQIIFDNIAPDKNGNAVYFRDSNPNRPEEIFKDKGLTQKSIYAEINKKDQNQLYYLKGPQEVRVTDIKTQEPFTPKISISDESGTKGRIKAVSIDSLHYIEVTKRGISGEIIKVAVFKSRNENELGTGYRIIDEFDLNDCNKKIEENPIKSALGNAKVNPCEIIKDAESENNRRLSLGGVNERTLHINGKPYALEKFKLEASTLECADINSINECRILFGACDPVMCPPSRFDFDGRWKNIDNVIQSGISGSIVLGLHNYDPPYEPLPVCVTGIRAGLKNIQSIFVGYNECLQRKKLRGEAIGGCSYIRSLGWCQVVWGEATSILGTIGTERIVQLGAKAIGQGGNEYVQNFHENFKRSNEFLSFFTSQYGQNVFAAYRGKGTKEIGSEFCEAAIFGRLPGQGSIIDQLSKPSVPAQFFAVFDESPHVDVDGEQLSNYRILYHVYAGEDHDIRYIISLKRSDTGKEKQVTYSTYLQKGRTDQNTVNVIEDSTYDQICVRIDGSAPKCGFGKVGTEFAISYAQEKLLEKEYAKNANNERECISDSTMIVTNPDIVTTPLSLIASGVKETGARRTCSQENPGKGTISENKWVQRGSCGKDAQGRDLGKCWLDTESLNFQDEKNKQKIKELEELNQRLEELRDNKEIKESLQNLEIKKLTLDSNLKALFSKINALLSNTVQIKNALNTIEQQYLDLANEYLELNKQTIDPIFDGNIYFKVAELYQTLASIKLKIENLEKIAQTIEKAKTLEKGIKECPRSGDSYECGSMADGETAILPGTPISIKVNLRSEQIGTVQKVELEVYTTENNKKKQVDCDFWNLFNKNIIFDRADDITTRKNCGELISIRYQGSDEKFTSVYFTATLLKKGLEISKIEIPPEEKILTTKDIEKAKVTLERLKGFTGVNIEYIKKAVKTYNVDPSWIVAIITVESGGNEKAVSLCGAAGLGQLVVPTAKDELGLYVPDYKMMSTASYTNSRGEKVSCTVTFKNNDPAIPEHCYSEDQDECDYQNDQRFLPEFALPAIAKYLSLLRGDDPNKNYDIYTKGNLDYIFAAYNGGFCNSKNNYGALCDSDNCPGLKSFQCEKDAYYINTKGQTKNYVAYVNAYINHYKNSQEFIDLFKDELLASTQETVPEDTQLAVLLPPEVSIEEDVA